MSWCFSPTITIKILYLINDGKNTAFSLFNRRSHLSDFEDECHLVRSRSKTMH